MLWGRAGCIWGLGSPALPSQSHEAHVVLMSALLVFCFLHFFMLIKFLNI